MTDELLPKYFGNENINSNAILERRLTQTHRGPVLINKNNNNNFKGDKLFEARSVSSIIKSQKFATPGSFEFSETEKPNNRISYVDRYNGNDGIMLRRDLNRSPLILGSQSESAIQPDLLQSSTNLFDEEYRKYNIIPNKNPTRINLTNDSMDSGVLNEEDMRDFPDYPSSPVHKLVRRKKVEYSMINSYSEGESSAKFVEKNSIDEYSTEEIEYETLTSQPVVKVNYPQYGQQLLPNDTPLDLSGIKTSQPVTVPFAFVQETDSDEVEEENAIIDILNYEISKDERPQKIRVRRRCISNFIYRLFGCGEMSANEILERYPWVNFLPPKSSSSKTEIAENCYQIGPQEFLNFESIEMASFT